MDHVTSTGAVDRQPDEPALTSNDDVLDAEVVNRIEELHNAVISAEREHRSMWPKRAPMPPVEAEQSYLAEHGLASYNDFRLRIRRTVVSAEPSPSLVWEPVDHVEEPELSPSDELRRRIGSLLAAFRADTERLIRVEIGHVDVRTAEILGRASGEAAEILADADRHHQAALVSVKRATRRAKRFLAATEVVPVSIRDARDQTNVVLRASGEDVAELPTSVDVDVTDRVSR